MNITRSENVYRQKYEALRQEHQGCLDGDTAWAEKWRAKYEAAMVENARLQGLIDRLAPFARQLLKERP